MDDQRIRLLSIDPRKSVGLLNAGLRLSKIGTEAGYGSQLEGEPDIDTVATRAVLVARADLPFDDVRQITSALFDGAHILGVRGGAEAMKEALPGLPLHPGASDYLDPPLDQWDKFERLLTTNWRILASLVILVGACQGLLRLKRDRTSGELGNRILAINLEARESESVGKLLEIRDQHDDGDPSLADRVQMRWWQLGELDYSRWRYLHDLINDRIKQAQQNLTADLADKLRNLGKEEGLGPEAWHDRLRTLEDSAFSYFQGGELDASHHHLLLEIIGASLHQVDEAQKRPPPLTAPN